MTLQYTQLGGGGSGATKLVVESADNTVIQNGSSVFAGDTITVNLSAMGDGAPIAYYANYSGFPLGSPGLIVIAQHDFTDVDDLIYPAGLWQFISPSWTYLGSNYIYDGNNLVIAPLNAPQEAPLIDGSTIKSKDPVNEVVTDSVLLDTVINNVFTNASLTPYVYPSAAYPTTAQSAIDAAVLAGASITNPKMVIIKESVIEDLTLYDGIFLRSMFGMHDSVNPYSPSNPNPDNTLVTITGRITNTSGSVAKIYGLTLDVVASEFGVFSSGPSFTFIDNCKVLLEDNTSTFLASNSIGRFIVSNTTTPTSAGKIFDMPNSDGYIDFYNCYLPSGTPSTSTPSSGSGLALKLKSTEILGGFSFSGAPFSILSIDSNVGDITGAASANISITGGMVAGDLNISAGTVILQNGYQVFGTQGGGATYKKYFWRENTSSPQTSIVKQLTGYNGSDFFVTQNSVQTSDATPTLIACAPLATNETYTVRGLVVGTDSTHGNAVGGSFTALAQRAGGNISLVGATTLPIVTGAGAFTVIADTSSQAIAVQVTGEVGITYNWVVTFEYHKVLTDL